jgi:hypothetical protein
VSQRAKEEVARIMLFRCGFCGVEAGDRCLSRRIGSGGLYPMMDFHMDRTRAAYPKNTAIDSRTKEKP